MKCKAPAADNLSREFSTDATMCCLSSFYVAASSCLMLETGTHREGIWEKGNEHEVEESMSKNSKGIDKSSWSLLTLASSVIFFHIYIFASYLVELNTHMTRIIGKPMIQIWEKSEILVNNLLPCELNWALKKSDVSVLPPDISYWG